MERKRKEQERQRHSADFQLKDYYSELEKTKRMKRKTKFLFPLFVFFSSLLGGIFSWRSELCLCLPFFLYLRFQLFYLVSIHYIRIVHSFVNPCFFLGHHWAVACLNTPILANVWCPACNFQVLIKHAIAERTLKNCSNQTFLKQFFASLSARSVHHRSKTRYKGR